MIIVGNIFFWLYSIEIHTVRVSIMGLLCDVKLMCLNVWLGFLKMIVVLLSHSGHQESLLGGHSTNVKTTP